MKVISIFSFYLHFLCRCCLESFECVCVCSCHCVGVRVKYGICVGGSFFSALIFNSLLSIHMLWGDYASFTWKWNSRIGIIRTLDRWCVAYESNKIILIEDTRKHRIDTAISEWRVFATTYYGKPSTRIIRANKNSYDFVETLSRSMVCLSFLSSVYLLM